MNIFKFIIIVYTTTEGKLSPVQYRQQYYQNNKIIEVVCTKQSEDP